MIPKYDFIEHIYQSDTTVIWRARSQKNHRLKIIKMIETGASQFDAQAKLSHEFQVAQKINHPKVIHFDEWVHIGDQTALVMEDFGGLSLFDLVKTQELDLQTFFPFALDAAQALLAVHEQGIVHKDVSPGNLLINSHNQQFKLIDFGISSELPQETSQLEGVNSLEGTLEYLAPEQTGRIAWPLDYRADFYGLGASLFFYLAGRPPFIADDPLKLIHSHLAIKAPNLRDLNPLIPTSLAAVVAKLLEKSPDDRYQSSKSLISDLESCQAFWLTQTEDPSFLPARGDISSIFKMPQTLFGREKEINQLEVEVEKAREGRCRLCLVTGEAGIGKSAIIGEAKNLIFREKGLFVGGKYNQLQAKTPFSGLLQALSKLLRHILQETDQARQSWQMRISKAVGKQGKVLLDVLPELGEFGLEMAEIEPLSASAAQSRFSRLFLGLIQALCRAESPLILFLDDLQWADEGSLNFIEEMLGDQFIRNLLIIGAYRQAEVGPEHPLTFVLARLSQDPQLEKQISRIKLSPLDLAAVNDLVAATRFCTHDKTQELAEILLDKTAGNPFFLHSYITRLHREGAITFHAQQGSWSWGVEKTKRQVVSQNVLQFLLEGINQLPPKTSEALGWAAVLGNQFSLGELTELTGVMVAELNERLLPALQQGYLLNLNSAYRYIAATEDKLASALYRFQHDQVQEAAKELINLKELQTLHLKAARLLDQKLNPTQRSARLFDLVHYYNGGVPLVTEKLEREKIVLLNQQASQKSINANAYDVAVQFAQTGLDLLGEQAWDNHPTLAFSLVFLQYEAHFLSSKYELMDRLFEVLLEKSGSRLDKAKVLNLQMLAAGNTGSLKAASELAVKASAMLGLRWPKSYGLLRVLTTLLGTKQKALKYDPKKPELRLPSQDAEVLMLHEILLNSAGILYQHNPNQFAIAMLNWTQVSLEKGFSPRCVSGFVTFAIILMNTGSVKQAYGWSDLATALIKRYPNDNALGKTKFTQTAFIEPWRTSIHELIPRYSEIIPVSLQVGDTQYALFAANHIAPNMLVVGSNLDEVINRRAINRPLMSQIGFTNGLLWDDAFAQTAKCLQGRTASSLSYDTKEFNEEDFIKEVQSIEIVMVQLWYYIFKCYCLVFFGHYKEAVTVGALAEKYRAASEGLGFMTAIDLFYGIALLRAAEGGLEKKAALKQAKKYQKKLARWALGCEANFGDSALLLEAEIAWFQGKHNLATTKYLESINRAAKSAHPHLQALAFESLAKLYQTTEGNPYFKELYLKEAVCLYQRWGAYGKVEQLIHRNPDLRLTSQRGRRGTSFWSATETDNPYMNPTTSLSSLGTLDFESLLKATQTLSEEINSLKLQQRLFNLIIETAGAQKAWLLLKTADRWQVVAQQGDVQPRQLPTALEECDFISRWALQKMIQSVEPVVSEDASKDEGLRDEPYVKKNQIRSVLCQPLILGQNLLGAFYLENNLISGCFTKERLSVLQIISSQAAISLENARLFDEARQASLKLEGYAQSLERKVNQRTAELQKANEAKEKFFSIIAHDLRGPIGSINVILNEVVDQKASLDLDLFRSLQESSRSTYQLLENLLTWARSQKGTLEVHFEEFDLNDPVQESCALLEASATAKGIQIKKDLQLDHLVWGDLSMIQTVVRNLLSNAIKFGTFDSTIWITAKEVQNNAEITVTDQGRGLSPQQVEQILAENYPMRSERGTNNERGTGLGLVLCREFVKQNKGTLRVNSELGKGSQFFFSLALGKALNFDFRYTKNILLALRSTSIQGLLVEDDPLALRASSSLLSGVGVRLQYATNGEEALAMAETGQFQVVFMDIELPLLGGLEATQQIRTLPQFKNQLVVALTSYTEFELAQKAEQKGGLDEVYFDGYLNKPPSREALLLILNGLLDLGGEVSNATTAVGDCILVVDDNQLNLRFAEKILVSQGKKVCLASSGPQALELLTERTFKLIFLDLDMPLMDGYDVGKRIRQTGVATPIVGMSLTDNIKTLGVEKSKVFERFITKPMQLDSIKKIFADLPC